MTIRLRDTLKWNFTDVLRTVLERGDFTWDDKQWIRRMYAGGYALANQEQGINQYVTPSSIVQMVHAILQPRSGQDVMDLSCGTGAWFEDLDHCHLHGIEVDPFAADLATIMHPNAMVIVDDATNHQHEFDDCVDFGFGTPPFGVRVPGDWEHKQYASPLTDPGRIHEGDLRHAVHYSTVADSAAIFTEMTIQALKPGGVMAMVLPYEFTDSPLYQPLQNYLLDRCQILAVINLPPETFRDSGVMINTNLIIAQKKDAGWLERIVQIHGLEREGVAFYPILHAAIASLGWNMEGDPIFWHDTSGRPITDPMGNPLVRDESRLIPYLFRKENGHYRFSTNTSMNDLLACYFGYNGWEPSFKEVRLSPIPGLDHTYYRSPAYFRVVKHLFHMPEPRDPLNELMQRDGWG